MRKKLYLEPANPGNLMFRLMFAEHVRRQVPGAVITGASLPEWGILLADDRPKNPVKVGAGNRFDVPGLIKMLNDPDCDGAVLSNFGLRLKFFERNRNHFTQLFQTTTGGQVTEPDELVIHVRAGDILTGLHEDYSPVPIAYYRRLVESTGLKPVFNGQTRGSYYSDALRKAFPNARFLSGNHWIDDFQTTRNVENIVIGVSSFIWLGAWLSETAKQIYMPQLGLFNPQQRPDVDLAPKGDPRYIFEQFPVEKFKGTKEQIMRLLADSTGREPVWAGGAGVTAKWMGNSL